MKSVASKTAAWLRVEGESRRLIAALLLALAGVPFFRGGIDPLGLLFTALCLFLATVALSGIKSLKYVKLPPYLAWPAGLLVALQWLSLLWSKDTHATITNAMSWTLAALAGAVALILFSKQSTLRQFIKFSLLGGVVVALVGAVMYVFTAFDRAASLFFWPNPLALYLGMTVILGFWQYRRNKSSTTRWILCVLGSVFLLTQSLATFVFLSLILAGLVLINRFGSEEVINLVVVIAVSIAASSGLGYLKTAGFGNLNVGTPDGFNDLVNAKTDGVGDRFDFWEGTIGMWRDTPVLGHGGDSFATVYPQSQISAAASVQNPHNIYLQTLAELGVAGAAVLVWLLAALVIFVLKSRQKVYFLSGALLLWLLHAGFYQTNLYPTLMVWLFVLLALLAGARSSELEVRKLERWMLPTLAAALALILMPASGHFVSSARGQAARDLLERGKFTESLNMSRLANSQALGNPDYVADESWISYLIERENAMPLIELAIERDKYDARHHYLKGLYAFQADDNETAETSLKRSIELDSLNIPRTYVVYSNLLLEEKRYEEAAEILDSIIAQYPDSTIRKRSNLEDLPFDVALLHWQRSRVALDTGNFDTFIFHLQRTLDLNPNYKPAQNLARQLAE